MSCVYSSCLSAKTCQPFARVWMRQLLWHKVQTPGFKHCWMLTADHMFIFMTLRSHSKGEAQVYGTTCSWKPKREVCCRTSCDTSLKLHFVSKVKRKFVSLGEVTPDWFCSNRYNVFNYKYQNLSMTSGYSSTLD